MQKLWIVHRHPHKRAALVRLAGLAQDQIASGAPSESDFVGTDSPTAIVMALDGDFELELDFAHRISAQRRRASQAPVPWILLAEPADLDETARLFGLVDPDIIEAMPSARILRDRIASAFARKSRGQLASLAQRRAQRRIADRFSAWLGAVEVPGLLRALDPSLGALPLLIRGVPGSGRALTARYVELFRTPSPGAALAPIGGGARGGPSRLRIHAHEITPGVGGAESLSRRIQAHWAEAPVGPSTIWIDEIETLSASTQRALADWIVGEEPPGRLPGPAPHWIATAGPAHWRDDLEPALERAFAPLILEVPSLSDRPETLANFAEAIANDWSQRVGGPRRGISRAAIDAFAEQTWPGDRAEVEAIIRSALASTAREQIDVDDLRLGPARPEPLVSPGEEPDARQPVISDVEEDVEEDLEEEEGRFEDLEVVEATPAPADEEAGLPEPQIDWGRTSDAAPPLSAAASGAPSPDADESIRLSEASFALANETEESWRRLARSLAHEIRNPLVSIRTFAELLPEHHQDETFRERFVELVGRDVNHIDAVIGRMQSVARHMHVEAEAVDVSAMLEGLLDERRNEIQERRFLVLRELEREAPLAWAEADAVRAALAGLLDRALDSLPERGDLYVATRHIERTSEGESRLRILLRYNSPELGEGSGDLDELSPAANVLEYVLAENVARANGGSFTIDSSDARETLILFDLKTPS